MQEELEDRFSDIPVSVENLMNIAYIRSIGKIIGIEDIKEKGNEIIFIFENKERITKEIINGILERYNKTMLFKLGEKPILVYKLIKNKDEEVLLVLKEVLEYIRNLVAI